MMWYNALEARETWQNHTKKVISIGLCSMLFGTLGDRREKKGSFIMKKFVCFVLCVTLALSIGVTALAATYFDIRTTSTSDFTVWQESATSTGKNWHFTWESGTNISENCRAVVRIMTSQGNYASSLWVYSTKSTKYHPYNDSASYGKADTCPSMRLDTRNVGQELRAVGYFYN